MRHVVDANLSLALVLATPYSDRAQILWERWSSQQALVFAPDLWAYELTSALRKAMVVTGMNLAEAETRLGALTQLGHDSRHPPTPGKRTDRPLDEASETTPSGTAPVLRLTSWASRSTPHFPSPPAMVQ